VNRRQSARGHAWSLAAKIYEGLQGAGVRELSALVRPDRKSDCRAGRVPGFGLPRGAASSTHHCSGRCVEGVPALQLTQMLKRAGNAAIPQRLNIMQGPPISWTPLWMRPSSRTSWTTSAGQVSHCGMGHNSHRDPRTVTLITPVWGPWGASSGRDPSCTPPPSKGARPVV
jgi:hypothetical protein